MKKGLGIGWLAGVMAITSVGGTAHAANDDLIFQSRVDATTLNWIVNKTQVLMGNLNLPNYLSGTANFTGADQDNDFTMADLSTNPNFVKVQSIVSQVFNVNADQAFLRLRIPQVSYHIHNLKAALNSLQVNDPVLSVDTNVSINGVDIGLPGGIQFDLMIPNPTTGTPESYLTASLDPTSVSIPESLPPATFEASFQALRDQQISFTLNSANLNSLPTYVQANESAIVIKNIASQGPMSADQIHINPVTVRLGSLSRTVDFDEFKPLVQSQMNAIIGMVLTQIGNGLKTSIGPSVLTTLLSEHFSSDFQTTDSGIYAGYQVAQFSEPAKDQLALGITGTACTQKQFSQFKDDCMNQVGFIPARVISDADHAAAKAELTNKLETGTAGIALSISEEYLNHLLKATVDDGIWASSLASEHIQLGPKGVFLVMNQETNTPDLYLDLQYLGDGSLLQKIFIQKPLEFPLHVAATVGFENETSDGNPHLILGIDKILSDSNEIIHGVAAYGLPSKLIKGLKGEVAKIILRLASEMDGKKLVDIDLPVLKNLNAETSTLQVSQYGRLNIFIQQ